MIKKAILLTLFVFLVIIIFVNNAIAFSYFNTSVWNDRKSYDSNYFTDGTFNDITAAIVLQDFSGDPNSLNFQVEWPKGAVTNIEAIPFNSFFLGLPTYVKILSHDVASTSFSDWENITYDFSELGGVVPQPPDVFIPLGSIKELAIPTITSYDPFTHSMTWENNYEIGEITNFRVRIYGSIDTDDILFDSGGLNSSLNEYTFSDPDAINLLDAGAIFGIEARKFKSSTEFENNSIYITKTQPFPEHAIGVILNFFDNSFADGTLTGDGSGNSASRRLNALRNMLEMAADLISFGDIEGACVLLHAALGKCDGNSPPPDFVTGTAVTELYDMILELMECLECE